MAAPRVGDLVDQTKKPKDNKAPAIAQLKATGGGAINNNNVAGATSIPGVQRVGNSFSGTTGSWESPTPPIQAPTINNPTSIQAAPTPKPLVDLSGNVPTPNASISTLGNIKTMDVTGGTISSSSPKFGNSSPQRLADLDKTLANDKNPDVIANRLASSQMADQRYNDAYRNGLSSNEYNNPLGSTQLMKGLQTAKANNDIVGFGMYRDLLKEQLGNETTRAGQNVSAENAKIANQSASAKLGYDAIKDQQSFEANQRNKGIDQSIEVQRAQSGIEKNVSDLINNPQYMSETKSPSQTFSDVNRLGGDVAQSLDSIVGPKTSNEFRNTQDIKGRVEILQRMGLSPDQIQLMMMRYQQQ
jgi:hypothetical protein